MTSVDCRYLPVYIGGTGTTFYYWLGYDLDQDFKLSLATRSKYRYLINS